MEVKIRKEQPADHPTVFRLVEQAFENEEFSDHTEQFLVERLRKSTAFVPDLSLVAEADEKIVGHILLTKVQIKNGDSQWPSLALAPVSVLPDFQSRGVGSALITGAHQRAKELGYKSVAVLGHELYYPRFGYQPAHNYGIHFPFDVPKENCMVVELEENGLRGVEGMIEYPKEFYE